MAEILTKLVVDCATNTQTVVPLTPEEIEQLNEINEREAERARAEAEALQAKAEAKASALAKLTALGLTEEEAAAIAG